MNEDPITIEEALAKKKRKWPTVLVVIVAAALVGGLTYYFVNKKATTDKNNLQTQIDALNKKYADSQTALATALTSVAAPTTAPTTSSATTATPAVTLNKDIESVKFSALIKVNTAIGDALETPTYADLNGDNSEEALVVYRYSGSGNIADFYIYGMRNGSPVKLFTKSAGGTIAIKNGSVYVDFRDPEATVNVGKDNASMVLSHVKYTWNGTTYAKSNQ